MNRDGEFLEMITKVNRRLDALEKQSQPQEAVAEVRCRNGEVFGYISRRVFRDMLPLGTKLYTAPPDYEALLKENERLREALTELVDEITMAIEYRDKVGNDDAYTVMMNFIYVHAREALKKGE